MLLGGRYEFAEPDDVGELDRRPGPRARRARGHRRPHARPHRRVGHVPDAVRRRRVPGDVLRRPAVRRLDRPHRPARRRPSDDAAHPARQGAHPARRRRRPARATASRPRSAASAPPTRSCCPWPRTTYPAVSPEDSDPMSRPTPLSGFPELLPAARVVEREVDRLAVAHVRAPRLRQHRDPRRRAARPPGQGGEIDKEVYVLRRLQADDSAPTTPGWGCTST